MPAIADLPRADWHRLNRLLEQALALEGEARSAWLQQLPAADDDLAPLLARLLAATDATETADFVPRPLPLPAAERAGQRIGPYRLLQPLGEGGMGTVWRAARADGAFEREVALKLPRAEWIDRGLAQRFARERAVLASLNHPHIAQLFDAGWSETGRPYLALEYVAGEPILAWCDAHGLDTAARLRLFVDVVQAVAHAHAHLVVHRDLKPSNVLVTADGRVKLLDFGIAKLLAEDTAAAAETELTRANGRALTPSYAAPEQILGQPVTTATDLYALGVMLFELLTGERPYRLGRTEVASRAALEQAIVRVDAATPSAAVKDSAVKRALRGDLDAIVLKALKKQPEERYRTAAELADDLQRWLEHRPVQAQRDSRLYRLRRYVVRNRVAVSAVSAIFFALIVGLAATLWQAREARQEAEHANTIKQFVLSVIQEADPQASQRTRAADMALLDATRDRIARELATRPDLQLEVRLAIATAYRNRGAWEPARQTLRAAVDEARSNVSEDNLDLLTARVRLAEWPIIDGVKALEELDAVVSAARQLGKPAIPLLIDALLARKALKGALEIDEDGDDPMTRVLAETREILELAEQTFAVGHPKWVEAQLSMVDALTGAARRKEALAAIEPVYHEALSRRMMGIGHPVMLRLQGTYGSLLCANGRQEEGTRLLREHLELARKHHGPVSRALGEALMRSSNWTMYVSGDYKQVITMRREAYDIAAATEPIGSVRRSALAMELAHTSMGAWRPDEIAPLIPEIRLGHQNLPDGKMRTRVGWWLERLVVMMHFITGETARARVLAEELVRKAEGSLGSPSWAAMASYDLASAMRLGGDYAAAEATAERLVAHVRHRKDMELWLPGALGELAGAKLGLGKWQEAIVALDEAIAIRTSTFGQSTPFMPDDALFNLWRGQALLHLNRLAEAHEEFRGVVDFWRDFEPDHPMAAEAAWWYGHSLIATGEVKRGKAMVADARPRLAESFLPHLRPLASAPAPIRLRANRMSKAPATVAAR